MSVAANLGVAVLRQGSLDEAVTSLEHGVSSRLDANTGKQRIAYYVCQKQTRTTDHLLRQGQVMAAVAEVQQVIEYVKLVRPVQWSPWLDRFCAAACRMWRQSVQNSYRFEPKS